MIDYQALFEAMRDTRLAPWLATLPEELEAALDPSTHGDMREWLDILAALPAAAPDEVVLNEPVVRAEGVLETPVRARLETCLRGLHPWRKGPFEIMGVYIDTEWRSDWKWQRLESHISPLAGRTVLDVGCGSGYHCWRTAGAGAALTIGIDPTLRFVMQFHAIKRYLGEQLPIHVLPLALEQLPPGLTAFDTVFSMGVLYHRRSPFEHLSALRDCLRPGGELLIETLVIEGGRGQVLVPPGRYAKMRNVWFIPSVDELLNWLVRAGFRNERVIDVSMTSVEEQRRSDWMRFESLADFLDPEDAGLTVEGLPAPRRAMLIADKPV